MLNSRVLIPLLLGFLCLLSGCSSGKDNRQPTSTSPTVDGALPQRLNDSLSGKVSQSSMRDLVPRASQFQKNLLQDGVLTLAEYEGAKLAEIRCLTDAGFRIEGDTTPNGLYHIRFLIVSDMSADLRREAIGECRKEFSDVLDMVWAEVSVPLVQDVIRESRRLMAECYRRNGLKVEERPHDSPDPQVTKLYISCLAQVDTSLDLGGVSYGVEGDGRPE